jgi:hypothetical protein
VRCLYDDRSSTGHTRVGTFERSAAAPAHTNNLLGPVGALGKPLALVSLREEGLLLEEIFIQSLDRYAPIFTHRHAVCN